MPTYKPIQSISLTSSASSVTFSGIDQNYTDLVLVSNLTGSATIDPSIQFNGDTGSNYSNTNLTGNGSTVTSNRNTSVAYVRMDENAYGTTSNPTKYITQIFNYSSTNTYKTTIGRNSNGATGVDAIASLWRGPTGSSTQAITSITVYCRGSGNFIAGSTFSLYGIKAGSIKASGGNFVTTDGNYWYHIFTSSGSLVTASALTCDVLSVGGGGGGGWNNAGGGGGGEVDILNNLSIASGVTKTVTIGGGGATATSTSSAGANGVTTSFASDTTSLGGGGGGTGDASAGLQAGQTGGSGGGGALGSSGGGASGSNTNIGGAGFAVGSGPERYAGGGGGGATSAGGAANTSTRVSGAGGQGYALSNIFSGLTISGLTHFGSGGSGGIYVNGSTGTAGTAGTNAGTGGQQSSSGNVNPTSPTINGGGGGGGGSYTSVNSRQGSNGASGIVIVRYPV